MLGNLVSKYRFSKDFESTVLYLENMFVMKITKKKL